MFGPGTVIGTKGRLLDKMYLLFYYTIQDIFLYEVGTEVPGTVRCTVLVNDDKTMSFLLVCHKTAGCMYF